LRHDTVLVSCMWVNNEIGVIQDIPAIAKLTHARGALLHVDAAQAVGPIKIDMQHAGVDMLSISAHKIYGPKGVGALLLRKQPRLHLQTQIHGGGDKRRAGTLPTALIVGLAKAVTLMDEIRTQEQQRQLQLREYLYAKLKDNPNIIFNGDLKSRIAGNLNFSVKNIQGDKLQQAMQDAAIMLSSGSACNADLPEPSHVLLAIGISDDLALAALRVSLGQGSTTQDIDQFCAALPAL
jgi:cysteine desulfurase